MAVLNIRYSPYWEVREEELIMRRKQWEVEVLGADLASKVTVERTGDMVVLRARGRVFSMSAKLATPELLQAAARKLLEHQEARSEQR